MGARDTGIAGVVVLVLKGAVIDEQRLLSLLVGRTEVVHVDRAAGAVEDRAAAAAADVVIVPEHADRLPDLGHRDGEPAGPAVTDEERAVGGAEVLDPVPIGREQEAEIQAKFLRVMGRMLSVHSVPALRMRPAFAALLMNPVLAATGTVRMTSREDRQDQVS